MNRNEIGIDDLSSYESLAAMVDADIDPALTLHDGDDDLHQEHLISGMPLQLIAFSRGKNLNEPKYWGEPVDINEDAGHQKVNLIQHYENPFIDYSRALAAAVQFPANTAFLHGLGVLSAAMIQKFGYERFGGRKHPGLYVVGAQPPSSGKVADQRQIYRCDLDKDPRAKREKRTLFDDSKAGNARARGADGE
jgi:hypothetical protein